MRTQEEDNTSANFQLTFFWKENIYTWKQLVMHNDSVQQHKISKHDWRIQFLFFTALTPANLVLCQTVIKIGGFHLNLQ